MLPLKEKVDALYYDYFKLFFWNPDTNVTFKKKKKRI